MDTYNVKFLVYREVNNDFFFQVYILSDDRTFDAKTKGLLIPLQG